jgi:hypothetical protein
MWGSNPNLVVVMARSYQSKMEQSDLRTVNKGRLRAAPVRHGEGILLDVDCRQ